MGETARRLLGEVFGYPAFRPGQEEVVDAVASGQDVLAIMPTGGGKSLCYQLPALIRSGVTVVVSPLIALMRDQVRALGENGVTAGALTSQNTEAETAEVFAALDAGRLRLLYMAPERLTLSEGLLRRIGVSLIAVDEAHCVSQWGHDFRPDYLGIGALRRSLDVPLAAFTATADADTRAEIITRLFDAPPQVFLRGFDRPNLSLAFAPKNDARRQLAAFVAARPGQPGIIYCSSRARTESIATGLCADGRTALPYHAGLDPDRRRETETRFQRDDALIIVATVAFGMGVDKPDIRFVAHADLPKSVEAYYQEIGRAGRDGAPADTLTLWGMDDIRLRRAQIDESPAPEARRQADHTRLNALLALAEAPVCRRVTLLGYFGEAAGPCGNCDLCRSPGAMFDGTEAVRKALSAILRTGSSFGAEHLIDVLLGEKTEKVAQRGHHDLPTFGVGREHSRAVWRSIFRQIAAHDLIRADVTRHGALVMTEAGRPVLKGEVPVSLRVDPGRAAASGPERTARALVAEENAPLLAALKAKRRELAEAQRVPAYIVFGDATLIEMAERRPQSLDDMARITGVGAKKLERYGSVFLAVITGAGVETPHPARLRAASTGKGSLLDALQAAQLRLARGEDGTGRFLTCTTPTLARIVADRPRDRTALAAIPGMGDLKADRFADAFLALIAEGDGGV